MHCVRTARLNYLTTRVNQSSCTVSGPLGWIIWPPVLTRAHVSHGGCIRATICQWEHTVSGLWAGPVRPICVKTRGDQDKTVTPTRAHEVDFSGQYYVLGHRALDSRGSHHFRQRLCEFFMKTAQRLWFLNVNSNVVVVVVVVVVCLCVCVCVCVCVCDHPC